MALGSWEPNFSWDDASAEFTWFTWTPGHADITALYECLKVALGPTVTLDDRRQSRTKRRKSKNDTERETNDGISYQAAKMTKCLVNYMAAGSQQHIIDYDFEYELENVFTVAEARPGEEAYEGYYDLDMIAGGWIYDATPGEGPGVHDIDLDWEIYEVINYMAAPVGTISIGAPPAHLQRDE